LFNWSIILDIHLRLGWVP